MKTFVSKFLSVVTTLTMVLSGFSFAMVANAADAVAPAPNPEIGNSCGIDMVLVMDTSTSIDNTELGQMRSAFDGFVDAFLPSTPANIAVVSFDDAATLQHSFDNDASAIKADIDTTDGNGSTNWEAGLTEARNQLASVSDSNSHLVVFASDGEPNKYGNNQGSGSGFVQAAQDAAVTEANLIKGDDTRIVTLGLGITASNVQHMKDISSDDAYYDASSFADLPATLSQIATDLCGGTLTVTKKIDNGDTITDPASDDTWNFNVDDGSGDVQHSTVNGSFSVKFDQAATVTISEIQDHDGYSPESASCDSNGGTWDADTATLSGVSVPDNGAVTCTFVNKQLPPNTVDLSVVKTVDNDAPSVGDTVTYTLTAHNAGPQDASDVAVSDTLPAGLTFVNASGDGSYDAGVWTIGALAAGDSATLTMTATVDEGTEGETLANVATVSHSDGDPSDSDSDNDSSEADVTVQTSTTTLPQCSDGIDNDGDGKIDYPADPGCSSPQDNDETNTTSHTTHTSHHGGGGGGSAPAGQVLGAEDVCNFAIDTYMRRGYKNNPDEVKILQQDILNGLMSSGLVVDGIYGPKTEAAVKAFQLKYRADILDPWHIANPTGIFYKTTLAKAKNLICPAALTPIPTDLVNWSQNSGQVPAHQ